MKKTALQKFIFIYNANAGLRNAVVDSAHKIWSPSTYNCSLCSITFGAFSEKKAWKTFRKNHPIAMEFLHKDEFAKAYASKFGNKFTFPIVLAETNAGLEVSISTEELNALQNMEDLMQLIQERS